MAKVFTAWLVGLASWYAAVLTFQFHFSSSQFGAVDSTARVALLAITGEYGPHIVALASFNTLIMATERRAKREFLQPVDVLPLWAGGVLALAIPIAMFVAFSTSLLLLTFVGGIPWSTSWQSMRSSYGWTDVTFVLIQWLPPTFILMFGTGPIMRLLFRVRGPLILKLIASMFALGLVLHPLRKIAVELVLHR